MTNESKEFSTSPSWIQGLLVFGGAAMEILRRDWSVTDLGSIENWPPSLAALTRSMLSSLVATAITLGPRRHLLCNAPVSRLLGRAGP